MGLRSRMERPNLDVSLDYEGDGCLVVTPNPGSKEPDKAGERDAGEARTKVLAEPVASEPTPSPLDPSKRRDQGLGCLAAEGELDVGEARTKVLAEPASSKSLPLPHDTSILQDQGLHGIVTRPHRRDKPSGEELTKACFSSKTKRGEQDLFREAEQVRITAATLRPRSERGRSASVQPAKRACRSQSVHTSDMKDPNIVGYKYVSGVLDPALAGTFVRDHQRSLKGAMGQARARFMKSGLEHVLMVPDKSLTELEVTQLADNKQLGVNVLLRYVDQDSQRLRAGCLKVRYESFTAPDGPEVLADSTNYATGWKLAFYVDPETAKRMEQAQLQNLDQGQGGAVVDESAWKSTKYTLRQICRYDETIDGALAVYGPVDPMQVGMMDQWSRLSTLAEKMDLPQFNAPQQSSWKAERYRSGSVPTVPVKRDQDPWGRNYEGQ